jgi:hypothetical protein
MFSDATFQNDLDWSGTTFTYLTTTFDVTNMFDNTNFAGHTITVVNQPTKDAFTAAATQISDPARIVVAP